MANLEGMRRGLGKYFTEPIVTVLVKTHLTPNAVTCLGLLITIAAAVLIALNHAFAAGFVVLFAGLFDMLDGALARRTNKVTKFGGVLDSTLDRVFRGSRVDWDCRTVRESTFHLGGRSCRHHFDQLAIGKLR